MPLDPYEAEIMRECRRGIVWESGGSSGSVCRKPDLCRMEGRCHFVASAERHFERVFGSPKPGRVIWSRGFDPEPRANPRIVWSRRLDPEPETLPMFGAA